MFKKILVSLIILFLTSCNTNTISSYDSSQKSLSKQPTYEENLIILVKEQYEITEDHEKSLTQHYKQAAIEYRLKSDFIMTNAVYATKKYGNSEHIVAIMKFDNINSASVFYEILNFDYSLNYDNSWYSDIKNFYLINNYVLLTNNKVYLKAILNID
jgi:hypothetical protein